MEAKALVAAVAAVVAVVAVAAVAEAPLLRNLFIFFYLKLSFLLT